MSVRLDREMAGALLSIFVPVSGGFVYLSRCHPCACLEKTVDPNKSCSFPFPLPPQFPSNAVSPVPRQLAWGSAGSTAEWNSAPSPPLSLFLMDYFSGTWKSQLSSLQSTTGHCQHVSGAGTKGGRWRQEGPTCAPHFNQCMLPRHCACGAWSSDPLTWCTARTGSFKCLQEAAVGIVCQEINQIPTFCLRSSSCHPLSPHEMHLDQATAGSFGDRQPKEPWEAPGSLSWGAGGWQHRLLWGQIVSGYLLNYAICH